jgi:Ulp1 family protease
MTITTNTTTQLSLSSFLASHSAEHVSQLQDAFQPSHDNTILINKFSIPITKELIQCLNPNQTEDNQWLNEEIINFYLKMLDKKF